MIARSLLIAPLALLAGCTHLASDNVDSPMDVHRNLLVLDTHLDTPINFGREGWDFAASHTLANDIAQVDLGRMAQGNLDGGFFVIYTAQGPLTPQGYEDALQFARERSDTIDREMARHPAMIGTATSAAEAQRLNDAGKLIALKSIENSYPLGEDLSLLKEFRQRGVSMAGPVHSANNQFADSATDTPRWNGLSPLGQKWVAEMNRLGMVIDASHASDAAFDQMLELSQAPIILSHSSPRWAFDHPRNLDDTRIRKLAEHNGAICMSTIYMSDMHLTDERAELFDRYEQIAELSAAEQADLIRRWRALDQTDPMWSIDFDRYMEAALHLIEVAGVDHVCFGADWDGGGGIKGMMDISALPMLTARLLEAGYTPEQIGQMTSGNVLRIMRAAEATANVTEAN
ncbi:dipeptidase [Altericroceibacterium endophyticum]|uniref:Membrane dipeptidase n=1 Tax=Altericroceibacterium endophyticum TaxID=1808508 RepID=A0A6I4T6B7_9SPHN|nr:dipeptidase [Altericroceibacterium endophyticum]MXO66744.1 membrane dipeptidase [Altericroceibacterium endophyticum]